MSLPERGLRGRGSGVPLTHGCDFDCDIPLLFTALTWFLYYRVIKMDVANGDEESQSESGNGSLPQSPTNKTDINPAEYYEQRLGDLAPFIPVRS
jgi:hypothetical protein